MVNFSPEILQRFAIGISGKQWAFDLLKRTRGPLGAMSCDGQEPISCERMSE